MIKPEMGTKQATSAASARTPALRVSLADALFSGTQQRVLGLLFGQPERSFYANELIALVNSGSGAVQRELARLAQSELVTVRPSGNQKHYQANPQSPIYAELCGIAQKTIGLAEPLRVAIAPLADHIRAAFVYGSVAKKQDTASSDVDLMVISDDVNYGELYASLEALSQRLGRTVNPTIYAPDELAQRIKRGDAFVTRVLQQAMIWIIGDDHALGL
ncbi:transcriptional regulator [Aquabacterium sp.]|uniref:transcriptional regulator n=1 Tax=Aquabacterium sp. TaxID=1872578 RepID=UPI002BE77028|nr:transcriptional regulator [Aquabacterium sp.]HSW08925.1 transcriptional regulator [Aquabacterium sp.]